MKYRTEYLESGGTICPFCKHNQIEGGPVEILDGTAEQKQGCLKCNRTWTAVFQLTDAR